MRSDTNFHNSLIDSVLLLPFMVNINISDLSSVNLVNFCCFREPGLALILSIFACAQTRRVYLNAV